MRPIDQVHTCLSTVSLFTSPASYCWVSRETCPLEINWARTSHRAVVSTGMSTVPPQRIENEQQAPARPRALLGITPRAVLLLAVPPPPVPGVVSLAWASWQPQRGGGVQEGDGRCGRRRQVRDRLLRHWRGELQLVRCPPPPLPAGGMTVGPGRNSARRTSYSLSLRTSSAGNVAPDDLSRYFGRSRLIFVRQFDFIPDR